MVAQTVKAFGRLDCALNNAGISGDATALHELSEEAWDRVLAVNLKGVFLCMKHEIAHMLAAGGGAIVNTSSIAGLRGGSAAYGSSKAGVIAITRSAACQYSARGIRINAICPGATDTPMTMHIAREKRLVGPIGRTGQPEEVAAAMLWLCSDAASYVTGHALPVDGGWMAS
jgi:NAD(P)-dependent dehydrogenase (short-subunit alcohol dehydrogenase family)